MPTRASACGSEAPLDWSLVVNETISQSAGFSPAMLMATYVLLARRVVVKPRLAWGGERLAPPSRWTSSIAASGLLRSAAEKASSVTPGRSAPIDTSGSLWSELTTSNRVGPAASGPVAPTVSDDSLTVKRLVRRR